MLGILRLSIAILGAAQFGSPGLGDLSFRFENFELGGLLQDFGLKLGFRV